MILILSVSFALQATSGRTGSCTIDVLCQAGMAIIATCTERPKWNKRVQIMACNMTFQSLLSQHLLRITGSPSAGLGKSVQPDLLVPPRFSN